MIVKDELLGQRISVVQAASDGLVGIQGTVVDETKHTLRIETMQGIKTLIKDQVTIRVKGFEVEGRLLHGRSEKRTKNKVNTWQRKKPQ